MKNIEELKNLKIEKVIVESWRPILFTCRLNNILYLGNCCNSNKKETIWLLNDISKEDVVKMLTNKISVKDALVKGSEKISIKSDQGCYFIGCNKEYWSENSEYLPKDETLDYNMEEINNIISFYTD